MSGVGDKEEALTKVLDHASIVWALVIGICDKVIKNAKSCGENIKFLEEGADPNLDDVIEKMIVLRRLTNDLTDILDVICSDRNQSEIDSKRVLYNASQQILNVLSLAEAVKNDNLDEFNCFLARLEKQPRI